MTHSAFEPLPPELAGKGASDYSTRFVSNPGAPAEAFPMRRLRSSWI